MSGFRWTSQSSSPGVRQIHFIGTITEEVDFTPILAIGSEDLLQLDLSGIELINSLGVREWIHFVRKLADAGTRYELVRCSPEIVKQVKNIANFRGTGRVQSVMLPYFCPSCRKEEHRELVLIPGEMPEIEEEIPCPHCDGTMEFDDIPSSYVAFHG